MLGHVAAALTARQESETRVRQFVADASHELRTPLASIRGYAELTRRGREPVPPDTAHALGRIESEATRMTALVEDLLLLARLDEGRAARARAGRPDPRSSSTRSATPARPAPTTAGGSTCPTSRSTSPATPHRLHQVVANLLANARTHTPPGTTVTGRLSHRRPGPSCMRVADDGPGIPAELLPRGLRAVRPRRRLPLARGRLDRPRAGDRAAVVDAHGGTVAVDSSPAGTAFTVRLPATGVPVRYGSPG